MAKGSSIINEKMVDKVMAGISEIFDKTIENNKEVKLMETKEKEEKFREEKEKVRAQFARICDEMAKADPASEKYSKLAHNLYQIKNILEYWV